MLNVTIALTLLSCTGGLSSSTSSEKRAEPIVLRPLHRSDLTPAEIKYGRAPQPDPSVSYAPGVVMVAGGAESIRSLSADGLTWTLHTRAARANAIQVGMIVFVTGRCVGRVLAATREGDDLRLVLGPVELTEIFRTLNVTFAGELDLDQAVPYAPPQFAGATFPIEGEDAASPEWAAQLPAIAPHRPSVSLEAPGAVVRWAYLRSPPQSGPVAPGIPQGLNTQFYTKPLRPSEGPGAELRHGGSGLRLVTQVQIRAPKPSLDFHIRIDNGNVDAAIVLKNAAGLKLAFDSAADETFAGQVNWYAAGPDFSIPLSGPVPLSITLKQGIWVRTAFSARSASFSAAGDYDLNADIGMTYSKGKFALVGPKAVQVRQSLLQNMGGVSIGPRGLVISHQGSLTAGVGAFGFTTGPQFELGTSFGIAQGSNVGIVNCRGVTLAMNLRGGVGWTIPKPVQKFVNFFLRLVRARQIEDYGGIRTNWLKLLQLQAQSESPICGGGG
jgi:hypothetical protein